MISGLDSQLYTNIICFGEKNDINNNNNNKSILFHEENK